MVMCHSQLVIAIANRYGDLLALGTSAHTMLAPTNVSFRDYAEKQKISVQTMLSDPVFAKCVVDTLVMKGSHDVDHLVRNSKMTISGGLVRGSCTRGTCRLKWVDSGTTAIVLKKDIGSANGVAHLIDGFPPPTVTPAARSSQAKPAAQNVVGEDKPNRTSSWRRSSSGTSSRPGRKCSSDSGKRHFGILLRNKKGGNRRSSSGLQHRDSSDAHMPSPLKSGGRRDTDSGDAGDEKPKQSGNRFVRAFFKKTTGSNAEPGRPSKPTVVRELSETKLPLGEVQRVVSPPASQKSQPSQSTPFGPRSSARFQVQRTACECCQKPVSDPCPLLARAASNQRWGGVAQGVERDGLN